MRHIVIDTETTGLDVARDRIVEVGAVELVDLSPRRSFHAYYNPGIPVPAEATAVHGLTNEFLAAYPAFTPGQLLEFLGDAPLIAHNAGFDVGILNAELTAAGGDPLPNEVIDSLALARAKHPGAPASLDALCRRCGISTAQRTKHGALLDAELLAAVYVELVGRQATMDLTVETVQAIDVGALAVRPVPLPPRLTAAEMAAHAAMMADTASRHI
ncbi:DNA polymerase III subunit epsilon [Mesorhizobium sp. ESP-6-4]|uniref:DNA polymerase III subunit epsilon n=1 Tax=Mesorhizobium sp. ESP-6-4 TaxID=2876624 RepID=UPI001CCA0735|nr:DNA polymerase III subunit epsilon [Mesorhizobium sp. ESP-6-4]MBZ9659736.1 DNA polymerase III subunit epsilon [Mesorhizobium sp. ESP-6-4]